ncbi:MAG: hypothetical protein LBK60_12155 [Verrucomicrobiales bacterium]|jgi:hypothetical protein|nr:hypothetical protein [Verrucomicrobiales bacterium]
MAEQEVKYKIGAVVELRALRELEASLQKQIAQMRALGTTGTKAYQDIERQLSAVQGKLGGISFGEKMGSELLGVASKIPVLGEAMRALNGAAGPFSAALTAAATALGVLKKSINEYAQAEEAVAGLDAALARNGLLTDAYRVKLQDLASQLQETTAIADDKWYGVLQKLTQFGAGEDNIDRYTDAVKNLAGIMGGDIDAAATVFAKAMQGNYDTLGRYGIRVVKTGDQTKDLDLLMQQLAQRGGGVLEARARSLNGQFRQLGNTIGDFFEGIGRGVARTGILQKTLEVVTESLKWWGEALGGPVEQLDGLTNKVRALSGATERSKEAADEMAAGFKRIGDASGQTAKELDRQTAAIKRLQSAQDELDDANMALELATLDADSQLAEPDKLRRRTEIRERYARQKVDRANAADQETIAKNEAALGQGQQQRQQSIDRVNTQRERAREAAALDEDEGAAGARLQATLDALTATEKELAAMQEERARRRVTYGPSYTNLTPEEERDEAALRARLKQQQGLRDRYQGEMDGYAETRKNKGLQSGAVEREALKDAEKKDVATRTKIDEENLARAETIRQLRAEITLREKLYAVKSKTEGIKAAADVNKAQAAENKKQAKEQSELYELQAKRLGDEVKAAQERLAAARERAPTAPALQRGYMESPQAFAERERQAQLDTQKNADAEVAKAAAAVAEALARQIEAQLAAVDAKLAANPNATDADRANAEYEREQIRKRGEVAKFGATAPLNLPGTAPDAFAGSAANQRQDANNTAFRNAQANVSTAIKDAAADGQVTAAEQQKLLGLIDQLIAVMKQGQNDTADNGKKIAELYQRVNALRTN